MSTPGPWTWHELGETNGYFESPMLLGPEGWDDRVLTVYTDFQIAGPKENAALIAAAPDLLEALERIANWDVEHPREYEVDSAPRMLEFARAAVAKVKGETV